MVWIVGSESVRVIGIGVRWPVVVPRIAIELRLILLRVRPVDTLRLVLRAIRIAILIRWWILTWRPVRILILPGWTIATCVRFRRGGLLTLRWPGRMRILRKCSFRRQRGTQHPGKKSRLGALFPLLFNTRCETQTPIF